MLLRKSRARLITPLLFLFLFTGFTFQSNAAGKSFPEPPRDYVYDEAALLSPDARQRLSAMANAEDQKPATNSLLPSLNRSTTKTWLITPTASIRPGN